MCENGAMDFNSKWLATLEVLNLYAIHYLAISRRCEIILMLLSMWALRHFKPVLF